MNVVISGSIAYDYIMTFAGNFKDHILPDKLDRLSLSFLVESLTRQRGGIAANIAYTLALLGEKPDIMATVGEDFEEYRLWLESKNIDTSEIEVVPGLLTASFFVNTDLSNAQIASFYTGAMARASDLKFAALKKRPDLAVISPNDPQAMVAYVQECKALNIPYFYDPGQQLVLLKPAQIREGIEGAAALFVNDYEFGLIEESTGITTTEAASLAGFVVVTEGENGATLYLEEESSHVKSIPGSPMVDPTGVGDAFRGGFLKGYMHTLSLVRCIEIGVMAATYCLEFEGTQGHEYDLADFAARFREHFDDQADLEFLQS